MYQLHYLPTNANTSRHMLHMLHEQPANLHRF